MNERLNNELHSYKEIHGICGGDGYLPELVRHFYNLALEDVKKEIEESLDALNKVEHLSAFEIEKAWNRGHSIALQDAISIIDQLSNRL